MKEIQLSITASPTGDYQYYIFRSRNRTDIDSIDKIKSQLPVMIVDEAVATKTNGKIYVTDSETQQLGVQYYGPVPSAIRTQEYETKLDSKMLNQQTYLNVLSLIPIEQPYNGIVYYYGIIAVKDNQISNLSHLNAVLYPEQPGEYKEIYIEGEEEDLLVATVGMDDPIVIGDMTDPESYLTFGSPVQTEVPNFDTSELTADYRYVASEHHVLIALPNPFWMNKKEFNYRELNRYKIRIRSGSQYGAFSVPTYNSVIPVPIEKISIYIQYDPQSNFDIINNEKPDIELIRKNGYFYENSDDFNPLNDHIITTNRQIYSSQCVWDQLLLNIPLSVNQSVKLTVYCYDCYGCSKPVTKLFRREESE